MKIKALIKEVKVALLIAGSDETRLSINSVCFDVRPEWTLIVATDGRRLCVIKSEAERDPEVKEGKYVATRDFLLDALKVSRWSFNWGDKPAQDFDLIFKDGRVTASFNNGDRSISEIDFYAKTALTFPAWRQVIIRNDSAAAVSKSHSVAPKLLRDFLEAAKILGANALQINATEENSPIEILIPGAPKFYGIIMPIRESIEVRPAWVGIELARLTAPAAA